MKQGQSIIKIVWNQLIKQLLVFVAAIWFMFEEWIWDHILVAMKKIASYKLISKLESQIAQSNRYTILILLMVPGCIMFPAKLYSLYLIGIGKKLAGASLFILIKILGTAIATRLFTIGKDKLLTIRAFRWVYDRIILIKTYLMNKLEQMEFWQNAKQLVKKTKEKFNSIKEGFKLYMKEFKEKFGDSRFNLWTKFNALKRLKNKKQ